jgi:hypothetical protein
MFIWTDRNLDERVQTDEVALHHTRVRGLTVMDDLSFCVASLGGRAARLRPTAFSVEGVPSYELDAAEMLAEGVLGPRSSGGAQMLADDSDEMVVTLGVAPFHSMSICGVRNGSPSWSYPSLWPGLHASHHAARPDRPGELVGTTRLLGGFIHPRGSQVGPLWAVNGNMGNFYLFTRDGLFVATVFRDSRQGKPWRMPIAERGMSLEGLTLHDENFWPTIAETPDGEIYAVDGSNSSLVRLDGLDSLRPIGYRTVEVTAELLSASQEFVIEREARRQKTLGRGVLSAAIRRAAPRVDGKLDDWTAASWVEIDRRGAGANFNSNAKPYNIRGAVAVAGGRLYAVWDTQDRRLLRNSGEIPNALFKTGGALDLMLGTDPGASAKRRAPVAGDLRLVITRVGNATRGLVYRQVVPGTAAGDRIPFSSPWRTITFDAVEDVSASVTLAEDRNGCYEVSVPLAVLGLTPKVGGRIKADMGILRGSGSETTARCYWSNKATGITADVPSEAMLTPHLWGTLEWVGEK